ncbi:membrane-bound lytic murein transglycosylase MltF, partial [Aquisalimonas sp.]|uniref:membrane-bound lytic murein transglycosylase MltF n=1 Tax=Aquisalimonas sp. TaxID=1872621 RepID=UPI0025B7ACA7
KSIDEFRELSNAHIKVLADSKAEDRMRDIDPAGEEINWFATRTTSVQDLLYGVWTREIDLTVVDSNELALNRSYYPELQVGFTFDEPRALAWAFLDSGDDSLHEAAEDFLDRIRNDGTLDGVRERYYGYLSGFDYVGARIFLRHVTERLPDYREDFQRAAQEHDLDWRLLAALSYQESHWDPGAVSRTGVRGMMMLTQRTAGQLGVENRRDATQSIEGGARYLRSLKDRLPERIEDPTRTWMALAAYNVGMGHLQDARALTKQQGKDPDNWAHLREHLPLLSRPEWYQQTRYGYARGWEPVHYVRGVRSYYERLLRITEPSRFRLPTDADWEKRRAFSPGDAGHVQLPMVLEAAQ